MISIIDIPFSRRHCCWFCGEPSATRFSFPNGQFKTLNCPHPPLQVPSCGECQKSAQTADCQSIWLVLTHVKKFITTTYRKDLAIGNNWTKEELENSEFDGGNFAGFKRSAWFMYEVAKARVNYVSWPISVDGIEIPPDDEKTNFIFDGVDYPNIEHAIDHYVYCYQLDLEFFKQVLAIMSLARFSQAVRFCRLMVGASAKEREQALRSLT